MDGKVTGGLHCFRMPDQPRLYSSLAEWWPLLSDPADYAEEAGIYSGHLLKAGDAPALTLLELGSGGGNNASHMKQRFRMTLADVSAGMLAVSRLLNPDCEHVLGDMRTLRLDRQFDRVFIHDAICYMATLEDLRAAIHTAFVHCRPGGAALFAPDYIRENFRPSTDHGGHDGPNRSLRFLDWTWDPDPDDTTYTTDYAYLLRHEDGSIDVEHDRHIEGLFSRGEWLALLESAGFRATAVPFDHSEVDYPAELLIGVRDPA